MDITLFELFNKYIPNKAISENKVIVELSISFKSIVNDCMRVIFSNGFDFNHNIWYIEGSSVGKYRLYMGSAYFGYVDYIQGDDYGEEDIEFKKLISILNLEYGVGEWEYFVFPINIRKHYWEYMNPMIIIESDKIELSFGDLAKQFSGFKYRCWQNIGMCLRTNDGRKVSIYDIINDSYFCNFINIIIEFINADDFDEILNSVIEGMIFETTIKYWDSRVLRVKYKGNVYFMKLDF